MMKILTLMLMMSFSVLVVAGEGELMIHGNFEDEQYCSNKIRNLGCGDVESSTFNNCVTKRISELEPKCQDFHLDEMGRQLDVEDSKEI